MNTSDFTNENNYFSTRIEWVRPNISHDERRFLYSRSNLIASIYFVTRLMLHFVIILMTVIAFEKNNLIVFIFGCILNGLFFSFSGWAGISHELFHNSVFRWRKLNTLLSYFFSTITWNNFFYFRYSHYLHHRYALWDNDPEAPKELKPNKFDLFWQLTLDVPFFFRRFIILSKNSCGIIPGLVGKELANNFDRDQIHRKNIIWGARIVLFFHSFFLVMCLVNSKLILFFILSMGSFTFTLVARTLETVQHHGMLRNENDFRLNTRTVLINPFIGLLYANMNYHVEHHIFPAMPFYKIKKANLLLHHKDFISKKESRGIFNSFRYLFLNSEKLS